MANPQARFTATNSISGWNVMILYRGAESLVKAVEVAKTGGVSRTHSLAALSQQVGLWSVLSPEHKQTILLLERYGALANYPDDPGHHLLTNSTGPLEAVSLLTRVSTLFDFVDHCVLTDAEIP